MKLENLERLLIKLFTGCIGFMVFILFITFVLANPYKVDENFEMGQNDIYNASNINSTRFWQNGLAVLDTNSSISVNLSNLNQSQLNVNSSIYWDGETSQANLNVNHSNSTSFIDWSGILNKFITAVDNIYIYMSGTNLTLNETYLNNTINSIVVVSNDSMKTYVDGEISGLDILSMQDINDSQGNWSGDRSGYYTSTQTDNILSSIGNWSDDRSSYYNSTDDAFFNNLTVTNNISAIYYFGNGSQLTGINPVTGNPFDQSLNTTDQVIFNGINLTDNLNMTSNNITTVDCVVFISGGKICSGS